MALVASLFLLPGLGCDAAFDDITPTQKLEVPMSIFPNNGRRGQAITVIALPAVPSPGPEDLVHVVDLQLPAGMQAQRIISNGGSGCTDERVGDLLRLLGETTRDRFPVCVEISIESDAPEGDADFALELVARGQTVTSAATFSILPALEEGE